MTWAPEPPAASRVTRRALVFGALSARALTENDPTTDDIASFRRELWAWIEDCSLVPELEPHERTLLESMEPPAGQPAIDAVWTVEALGILAWALRLAELPGYCTLVTPMVLWKELRVLRPAAEVSALVNEAQLRSEAELDAMRAHQLAFHWRMRDLRLRPVAMDFVAFSRNCWFGSFPLDGFEITKNDLALNGVPVSEATREARSLASSIAMERHRAINWLVRGPNRYSATDVST
jgi:hypothetical protein